MNTFLLKGEGEIENELEYIYVDPPGDRFEVSVSKEIRFFDELPSMRFVPDVRTGRWSSREELTDGKTSISLGSVLDELRIASEELEKHVAFSWDAGQAAWFILTGKPPVPFAAVGEVGNKKFQGQDGTMYVNGDTITLEIEPWVPAETVFKLYRELQLRVLAGNPRHPGERNLRVFTFVATRRREEFVSAQEEGRVPQTLSSRELMEEWNHLNPNDSYAELRNFNRDRKRASNKLFEPWGGSSPELLTVPDQSQILGSQNARGK